MSDEGQEQNKSEEPTPHKLKRAREKGQVARSMDLGFVGSLTALAIVATIGGQAFFVRLAEMMRYSFTAGISGKGDPLEALGVVGATYWGAFQPLIVLGLATMVVMVTLEVIQLRGFIFTTHPLKPDFKRLNPAAGLKRLFSVRMIKETLKNVVKFIVYGFAAWLIISAAIDTWGLRLVDASWLARAMEDGGTRLLFAFIVIASFFMVIDQIIVRGEFRKQMRMGHSELKRETREREGEPRQKQKRKEIHRQMREQADSLGKVAGSDVLVVNPEHYAVALRYDPETMDAPKVVAKGRDHFAQLMKRKALLHSLPVIRDVALARRLHSDCAKDAEVMPEHYQAVAQLYRLIQKNNSPSVTQSVELETDSLE
ncbi:EscU/YscU/HrcU family type III secretion system export apparatus switch protein [Altererythrobacter sp. Z27]|uniref:EscU/YscU/HrcU family type III secretion system export apparatus switch protein n=1 Tax=Altererythrobacter sp. Z27 TaxID=3461147 RepID=UPI004043A54A